MSDIKLFRINDGVMDLLDSHSAALEKSLQTLMERNLETLLGVRFLATEYDTGKKQKGRIDTLGIDENGGPVIIEYKRTMKENIINQGLFYLSWLLDHKAEFKLLVMDKLGKDAADAIEWKYPRVLCIAGDFTRYDEHAVQQINRNIELIRYRKFGDELLLLEQVNAVSGPEAIEESTGVKSSAGAGKTIGETLSKINGPLLDMYESLKAFLLDLGDDVQMKILKLYIGFRRIKNFACVEIHTQKKSILVFVKVNPDTITLEKGFTRDVRNIGHYGTGGLEITISSSDDLEKAKPLLLKSYENN